MKVYTGNGIFRDDKIYKITEPVISEWKKPAFILIK